MTHTRKLFAALLCLASALVAVAQDYPKDYFQPPMRISPSLSATFGEVRANHYHSGLDMRTGGEIGQPVYAAADGYVSRVNISAWGGGKIVYIDHPNGYRTVYMHLNDFCGDIADWVRDYQYSHHTFAFDTNVAPGRLPVKQGQMIAHSGNTGSSGGPHLHYEIRHAHNDQTINAQLFGLFVPDGVAPVIKGIRIYPADGAALVNGKNAPLEIMQPAQKGKKGQKARHATTLTPTVSGAFYVGIHTTDRSESYAGNNGVYRIELRIDGEKVYEFLSETFRFEDTRSVNAIMDYPYYCATRRPYILTRTLPYAPVTSSHPKKDDGIFRLAAGSHTLRYDVYDINGNHASKTFSVVVQAGKGTAKSQSKRAKGVRRQQTTATDRYQIEVPAEALYTDDSVVCEPLSGGGCCQVRVRPAAVPVGEEPMPPHVAYTLRLPLSCGKGLAGSPRQWLIARRNGKRLTAYATTVRGEWLEIKPRDFGTFEVVADTTPPTIRPPKNLVATPGRCLVFRLADNLAGVDTYNCYLNGRWILAEYDGKSASISVKLPARDMPYGEPSLKSTGNRLTVVVSDLCGNTTTREFLLQ